MQVLNNKGSIAWKSTGDPFLDLFANNNLTVDSCLSSIEQFREMSATINHALTSNLGLFLKLMKYTRSIDHGKGEKLMYYIMMSIFCHHCLKNNNEDLYPKVLSWSYECKKDILHLCRINTTLDLSRRGIISALTIYAEGLHKLIESILNDQVKLESGSLLWLKYINTGHFKRLSHLIWSIVEPFDVKQYHPKSSDGQYIHHLLTQTSGHITNRVARLIKSRYHEPLHLLDKLFQGCLPNGTNLNNTPIIVDQVSMLLGQCAAKCGEKSRKTIKKYQSQPIKTTNQQILVDGLIKYVNMVKEQKIRVKVHGLDLADQCMDYFQNQAENPVLEAQLRETVTKLRQELKSLVSSKKLRKIGSKLNVIIDYSGSMEGTPLNSALLQALIFWEIFHIKNVYMFADQLMVVDLPIIKDMCPKIKYLYTKSGGSTNLQSVFDHLVSKGNPEEIKMNLILTDGDCDPNYRSNSPFQTALTYFPKHMFCVFNLKEKSLAFPYLMDDPRVCYISGHNPSIINGVIKCLAIAVNNGIQLNPTMILEESLKSFDIPFPIEMIPIDDTTSNPDYYQKLYHSLNRNVPKNTIVNPEQCDISPNSESNSESE